MVSEVPIFAATPALRGALSADAEEGERELPCYPSASLAARSRPRGGAIRIAACIPQDHKSSLMALEERMGLSGLRSFNPKISVHLGRACLRSHN
jgi:hypothetical protein